jgi:hypothetical protein
MRLGGWPEGVLSAAAVALLGWVLAGAWLTRRRARTLGGPSAGPPSAGLGPREAEPGRTIES